MRGYYTIQKPSKIKVYRGLGKRQLFAIVLFNE
nr:MAG TPA: hypothetical protein [Bacteriophage sp.]